jgi:hypothetical protein
MEKIEIPLKYFFASYLNCNTKLLLGMLIEFNKIRDVELDYFYFGDILGLSEYQIKKCINQLLENKLINIIENSNNEKIIVLNIEQQIKFYNYVDTTSIIQ